MGQTAGKEPVPINIAVSAGSIIGRAADQSIGKAHGPGIGDGGSANQSAVHIEIIGSQPAGRTGWPRVGINANRKMPVAIVEITRRSYLAAFARIPMYLAGTAGGAAIN